MIGDAAAAAVILVVAVDVIVTSLFLLLFFVLLLSFLLLMLLLSLLPFDVVQILPVHSHPGPTPHARCCTDFEDFILVRTPSIPRIKVICTILDPMFVPIAMFDAAIPDSFHRI